MKKEIFHLSIILFIFAMTSLIFFACGAGDMIQEGINSAQDIRLPEINVKQGSTDISPGDSFELVFQNGVDVQTPSDPVIFTIENIGTADLVLNDITITNQSEFEDLIIEEQPAFSLLPAGTNAVFSVVFTPSDTDLKTATITMATTDFDEGAYTFTITGISKPVPDFSARLRRGTLPLSVDFVNKTQGEILSYEWDFDGDGVVDSTEQNPSFDYNIAGQYSVILTATGPGGTEYRIRPNYINITIPVKHIIERIIEEINSIYIADIDRDNDLDFLCTTGQYSELFLWKNDGNGTFSKYLINTSFSLPCSASVADIESDGDMDIIVADEIGNEISWLENDGDENFTKHLIDSSSTEPMLVCAADMDMDSDMDVLVAEENELVWWENDGNGNIFSKHSIDNTSYNAGSVLPADVDGDGDIDVFGATYIKIIWWENDGTGFFTYHLIDDNNGATLLDISDIDGDGDNDLLSDTWGVSWWENDGYENFTRHLIDNDIPTSLQAADIDYDGDIDFLLANSSNNEIAWMENDGNENFTKNITDSIFNDVHFASAADMDSDGDMDILGSGASGSGLDPDDGIAWLENDYNGFTKHVIDNVFDDACSIYASDMDSDGDMDVLGAAKRNNVIVWCENDGNGIFLKHLIDTIFYNANSVFSADIDGDGDMDALGAAVSDDGIAWWENNGNDNFVKHSIDSTFNSARSVFSANMDGDGDMDVLCASNSINGEIAWWENNGNENFIKHTIDNTSHYINSVFSIDIDGDGDMDVLGAPTDDNKIAWWENNGSEIFTKHPIASDFSGANSVFSADIDGDRDMDVLGTLTEGNVIAVIAWWENDGNENFTYHLIDNAFHGACSVYSSDIDGDGDMDILGAAALDYEIAWWENNGSGIFTKHTIASNFNGANSVFSADIDGDGDMDILGTAAEDDQIAWWENNIREYGPSK